jgi:superfamily II DNA/RNA helicase
MMFECGDPGMTPKRICFLTNHIATCYYLEAAIEDQGRTCRLLHGEVPTEDRWSTLAQLSTTGGVLIATTAMLQGSELPEVTDLVLYDLPISKIALQVVLGRFDRFGRTHQPNVHILTPSDVASGSVPKSLQFLHEIHEPSHKVQ